MSVDRLGVGGEARQLVNAVLVDKSSIDELRAFLKSLELSRDLDVYELREFSRQVRTFFFLNISYGIPRGFGHNCEAT